MLVITDELLFSYSGDEERAMTGYDVMASSLSRLGIKYMFGVIGIPVTQMASAAQAAGIRFISCRNEQAAGYAAAAAGFLTGKPGVLLTVSGPGMVHGIAGLSHAKENRWPMIMISGSCETVCLRIYIICFVSSQKSGHHGFVISLQNEVGKGAFQEHDQCQAASQYVKLAIQAKSPDDIAKCVCKAYQASIHKGFGPTYIDVPSNIFMGVADVQSNPVFPRPVTSNVSVSSKDISKALKVLEKAKR